MPPAQRPQAIPENIRSLEGRVSVQMRTMGLPSKKGEAFAFRK